MPRGGKPKLIDPDFSNVDPDASFQVEAIVAITDTLNSDGYLLVKVFYHSFIIFSDQTSSKTRSSRPLTRSELPIFN